MEAKGGSATATVVQDFARFLAGITDEGERARLLARVKMEAVNAAPEEAFAPVGRSAADLLAETPEEPDWLIPGLVARGWLVKFAAREKTGKGTLIAHLLGRLERREASVFGPPAEEGVTAVIYTEEPPESIREKVERAGLERAWIVYGWELAACSTWGEKVDRLVRIAQDGGHGVIFVDNVSRAAGVEDEAGVELARAAEQLGSAAQAAGLTVVIDHHHKKGAGKLDDKSRGGTALAGACDNNIEMVRVGGWDSRVRRLSSRGRLTATIWEQTIALSDDGRDYVSVADTTQPQTLKERQRLRALDNAGDSGMTASEAAAGWECSNDTARRQLEDFVSKGWASEDAAAYPARWHSTGEGLAEGVPVDLMDDSGVEG